MATLSCAILYLWFPAGVGYLDWICDIPAGYSFQVSGYGGSQYYTVQPGSSSCLGDLTTTYQYASYDTINFQFYTQHSPSFDPFYYNADQLPTVTFPTRSFPTITANPNLAVTSSAVSSTSSSPPTSSTPVSSLAFPSPVASSPASPHKSKKATIVGGIIGGAVVFLLTLTIIFVFLRRRRSSYSDAALESPMPFPGWVTSQPGSTKNSAGRMPSLGQERHMDAISVTHHRTKFAPNVSRIVVPDTMAQ